MDYLSDGGREQVTLSSAWLTMSFAGGPWNAPGFEPLWSLSHSRMSVPRLQRSAPQPQGVWFFPPKRKNLPQMQSSPVNEQPEFETMFSIKMTPSHVAFTRRARKLGLISIVQIWSWRNTFLSIRAYTKAHKMSLTIRENGICYSGACDIEDMIQGPFHVTLQLYLLLNI